jgi:rubrerythrin
MAGQRTVTFSTVPEVKTVEDLFAIATAMEREAANRYADLADRMERQGNGPLAALFRRLEKDESGHEDGLGEWARRRGIVPSPTFIFRWDMPETLTEQQFAEAGGDFLATPWRVLVIAAGNEERAFSFYANIAAKTSDPDVRIYAEAMAREELNHVALLRLERRRAWRKEHPEQAAGILAEEVPVSLDAFDRRSREAARDTLSRWRSAARAAEAAGDAATAELFRALVDEEAARLPEGMPAEETAVDSLQMDLREVLRDEARRTEASYDFMMAVAEKAGDEALVARAQSEAREKLSQLARLGDRMAALGARPSRPRSS